MEFQFMKFQIENGRWGVWGEKQAVFFFIFCLKLKERAFVFSQREIYFGGTH